jgi:dihydrofolate reductase
MKISMIVAVGQNNEIGRNNELMWHLPDDFKWFIQHTKHKTVVMGRNTMLSLGKPLKNRRNIVLSSKNENILEGFDYFESLEGVINEVHEGEAELMIIGGAQLYTFALPLTDRIYLTKVNATFEGADTFFPKIDFTEWTLVFSEMHAADESHQYDFEFQILERNRLS